MLQASDLTKAHDGAPLFDGLSFVLGDGERAGLVGRNGVGKSTLLRLLAGVRTPEEGRVTRGATVRAAFLSQELAELPLGARVLEAVEEVAKRVKLGDRELSSAQLAEVFGFTERRLWTPVGDLSGGDRRRLQLLRLLEAVEEVAKRVRLGDRDLSAAQLAEVFGFTDARVWTPVADLSGGERRRLQLLRLLATEPNVLLLDEPTNDLDIDTLAALEDLLDTWPGTMIVASHDRYLVERVTDSAYGMFGDGRLLHLPGGVEQYLARAASPATPAADRPGTPVAPLSGMSAADVRIARKELGRLERQLAKLEERIGTLDESLAEHGSDYAKIIELEAALKAAQEDRAGVEDAWLELAEQLPED